MLFGWESPREEIESEAMKKTIFVMLLGCLGLLAPAGAEVRTWVNAEGDEVEAEFVSQADGVVTIRRVEDGERFDIAIETLSAKDQEWLAAQARKASGGVYIAAGHGGHRMSSVDGITWTNHEFWGKPSHNQQDLKAIAAGNGTCVVVGGFSKSNILVTRDGVSWEKSPFNMGVLSGVEFVEGKFYLFGEGGKVASSADAETWEVIGDADVRAYGQGERERLGLDKLKLNVRAWRHANGLFVGAGDNCIIVSTRDFKSWHFAERKDPLVRLRVETDGKGFVVWGGQTLRYSTDGVEWTDVAPDFDERAKISSVVHDGERYVLNARDGRGWESEDGQTWEAVEGRTFPGVIAAVRPGLYYSFQTYWKYTENFRYSKDRGKTWESAMIPAPTGVTCVVFAEGMPKW